MKLTRIVLALMFAAVAGPAAAQAEKVKVRLDWTPWGAHAAIPWHASQKEYTPTA